MSELPKLKVKTKIWEDSYEVMEFELAKGFPFDEEIMISVEGQQISSYEEFLKFAQQPEQKDKEYLEVMILPMILGG